jgi:hypothetical protein
MKISEIKKWAKEHGYSLVKAKTDQENLYSYTWTTMYDPIFSGIEYSVSKVARAIYNHITNDAYVEHQAQYKANTAIDINHNEISR